MNAQSPLIFNQGVYLLPVEELPDDVLGKLEFSDGDYALTRPQGRTGSKIIDRDAADLIGRFRQPRTIVEAVVLFSRTRGEDPQGVLDNAFPFLKSLLASGYLVEAVDGATPAVTEGPLSPRWNPGDALLGGRVLRTLQVLEDTELCVIRRPGGETSVIKAQRATSGASDVRVRAMFQREGNALERLRGGIAPRLLSRGEIDGRRCLEMEYLAGVDVESEAARLRDLEGDERRAALLSLSCQIAGAYTLLHAARVVHGDVHPRNLLVDREGRVRLIDFGFAATMDADAEREHLVREDDRGGIAFFYEPELARAFLSGKPGVAASYAGEQYAIASMIYQLITGAHTRDFSLGRSEMLREIAELPPLPFVERGVEAWPDMEAVLTRALAKDPSDRFASIGAFAAALSVVRVTSGPSSDIVTRTYADRALTALSGRCRASADVGGEWWTASSLPAPAASINYGAAGVAMGMLSIAHAESAARPMILAQTWLRRAFAQANGDDAFYNAELEITPRTVGTASPYHSVAGLHAVAALLARSVGDAQAQIEATADFLAASKTGHAGLDLTLGKSSTLLGAALLLDALPKNPNVDAAPLIATGNDLVAELWDSLGRRPSIADADIEYLGIAHGWAGFLYATMTWCKIAGAPLPSEIERRLAELSAFARPTGRGLTWPWTLVGEGSRVTMPGWCNGSSGYVFLWTLAEETLPSRGRYLDFATGAAWDAWDAADATLSLCCGLAGRSYALLNLYRATNDAAWLDRARRLALRGATRGNSPPERAQCLWKGELGMAVLASDLERPEDARMPFFEPMGWS
jgi:serine/threonine-protein kinase